MTLDEPRWVEKAELLALRPQADGVQLKGLWVSGALDGLARPTIAVVGSRAPSEAGVARSCEFGRRLARAGVCVISGLALGIDGAAHAGALDAGGLTIGILGGGHRHFFPPRNRRLAHAMAARAGCAVLSPYAPEEHAWPGNFLQRNGIIAALADAVVIVEAAARSGSLNTASWAASRGIPVFAVPGDVDRPKAAGCNALIRDGATLVRDADDVLADLGLVKAESRASEREHGGGDAELDASSNLDASASFVRADPLECALLTALRSGPQSFDDLVDALNAPSGTILAMLMRLEIDRAIERRDDAFALAGR